MQFAARSERRQTQHLLIHYPPPPPLLSKNTHPGSDGETVETHYSHHLFHICVCTPEKSLHHSAYAFHWTQSDSKRLNVFTAPPPHRRRITKCDLASARRVPQRRVGPVSCKPHESQAMNILFIWFCFFNCFKSLQISRRVELEVETVVIWCSESKNDHCCHLLFWSKGFKYPTTASFPSNNDIFIYFIYIYI